ncbi:putative ribonuclease H-like domain-containing protein [Tanacetum coccineum]
MASSYNQAIADAGSENHPPMLEKGSYVPWSSRFMMYINGKKEYSKMRKDSIENGPYKMKEITDQGNPDGNPLVPPFKRIQEEAYLNGDDKKMFEADIDAINAILLGTLNNIYNFVDGCKTTQAMWQRIMNDLECHGCLLQAIANNTKFLNSLQFEWDKYVIRSAKRAAITHNPLALVLNHYVAPSSSHTQSLYCVTYPPFITDYDAESKSFEIHGDATNDDPMDSLTTTMMLLEKAITQHYSTPTNNQMWEKLLGIRGMLYFAQQGNGSNATVQRHLRMSASSGNAHNVQCYNCNEKGHYARVCPNPRVHDSNYFKEQMLLAKKD